MFCNLNKVKINSRTDIKSFIFSLDYGPGIILKRYTGYKTTFIRLTNATVEEKNILQAKIYNNYYYNHFRFYDGDQNRKNTTGDVN